MFYSFSGVGLRFDIFIKHKHNSLAEIEIEKSGDETVPQFIPSL